ncbi:hypothetical protein ES705_31017 [subsurface metagenome]
MSKWREKMKDWGGGDLTFLSSDGECIIFVVADEPILLKGKFKGKESERIGCPVVTDEGFVLLIIGKRAARKLSKYERQFNDVAFIITRHGVAGDINATYDVSVLGESPKTAHLFELKKKEYTPAKLKQAIKDAKDVVSS